MGFSFTFPVFFFVFFPQRGPENTGGQGLPPGRSGARGAAERPTSGEGGAADTSGGLDGGRGGGERAGADGGVVGDEDEDGWRWRMGDSTN